MTSTPAICPVCDSSDVSLFERRSNSPVMMNRLYDTREAARHCPRGELDLWRCRGCGFVWNRAFDESLIQYDDVYENNQMNSDLFSVHMAERAREVIEATPAGAPLDFLEVGCGQGVFLSLVEGLAGERLRSATGFDPAWRGEDGETIGRARIFRVYFDHQSARRLSHRPNVVASRHTIEHVPRPVTFLSAIRSALGAESSALLFIETPCIDWIIEHNAMQDLFYEHCSIFTARALSIAFERAGFGTIDISRVFSQQYLWGSARAGSARPFEASAKTLADITNGTTAEYVARWRHRIEAAANDGAVAIWGAGAKGVTFANLIDADARLIDCVIDINPAKQGAYIAGSGLHILSPAEAASSRDIRTFFVMNPNYLREIAEIVGNMGMKARLVPVE